MKNFKKRYSTSCFFMIPTFSQRFFSMLQMPKMFTIFSSNNVYWSFAVHPNILQPISIKTSYCRDYSSLQLHKIGTTSLIHYLHHKLTWKSQKNLNQVSKVAKDYELSPQSMNPVVFHSAIGVLPNCNVVLLCFTEKWYLRVKKVVSGKRSGQ